MKRRPGCPRFPNRELTLFGNGVKRIGFRDSILIERHHVDAVSLHRDTASPRQGLPFRNRHTILLYSTNICSYYKRGLNEITSTSEYPHNPNRSNRRFMFEHRLNELVSPMTDSQDSSYNIPSTHAPMARNCSINARRSSPYSREKASAASIFSLKACSHCSQ